MEPQKDVYPSAAELFNQALESFTRGEMAQAVAKTLRAASAWKTKKLSSQKILAFRHSTEQILGPFQANLRRNLPTKMPNIGSTKASQKDTIILVLQALRSS